MAEQKRPDQETSEETVLAQQSTPEEESVNTENPEKPVVTYIYPETLDAKFPARIIFTSHEIQGVNILKQLFGGLNALQEEASKIVASFSSDDEKEGDESDDKPPASNQEEKQNTQDDKSLANRVKQSLNVNYQSYENVTGGKKVGKVTLPLPRDLRYADVIQYETANLGIIGGALESGLRGQNPFRGVTTNGQFGAAASSIVGGIVARATGVAGAAAIGGAIGGVPGAILGAAAGGDAGDALEGAVRSASRIVAAPNQRTLFKSVELRAFNFTFKMIARNKREATTIKNIVKFFRQEMYPEVIPLGSSGVPLAYKFPNVFEIDIRNANNENPGFKIQRCYLRDVQTSFNSTAAGMFEDGQFVEVDVTLSFVEITALDKQKITQGY
jgi:hypothetical protein